MHHWLSEDRICGISWGKKQIVLEKEREIKDVNLEKSVLACGLKALSNLKGRTRPGFFCFSLNADSLSQSSHTLFAYLDSYTKFFISLSISPTFLLTICLHTLSISLEEPLTFYHHIAFSLSLSFSLTLSLSFSPACQDCR